MSAMPRVRTLVAAAGRRAREERGYTIVELLVTSAVTILVLLATLGPLDALQQQTSANTRRNEDQDRARLTVDRLTRELRNAQSQTYAIDRALEKDLIFQIADPHGAGTADNPKAIRRVRYCLDASNPNDATLYRQIQTWTGATPPVLPDTALTCPFPSSGAAGLWGQTAATVQDVVNYSASIKKSPSDPSPPVFEPSSGKESSSLAVQLWIDPDTSREPRATHLRTGIFLRNQNFPPTASFTPYAQGGNTVVLNGSGSTDPEGDPLTYRWCDLTASPSCSAPIGDGAHLSVFSYQAPASGTRSFKLRVTDRAGLTSESAPQAVALQP